MSGELRDVFAECAAVSAWQRRRIPGVANINGYGNHAEYVICARSPQAIADIQARMAAVGLLTGKWRYGEADAPTLAAVRVLMDGANETLVNDWETMLSGLEDHIAGCPGDCGPEAA